jgi:hypothetical protein
MATNIRLCLEALVLVLVVVLLACAYYQVPRVDAFLGEYGLREARGLIVNGSASIMLIAGNTGHVEVSDLRLVVWVDPPCILRMPDGTILDSGQYSYTCQPLARRSFATLLLEIEDWDPASKSALIHVDLLHKGGLARRKLLLHFN